MLPAAARYTTIICVRFFRARRGKTAHQQKKVPLCRRQKTADCVSPVSKGLMRSAFSAFGSPWPSGHPGSGAAVLYLLLCFVFALVERKNRVFPGRTAKNRKYQSERRQSTRHAG